MPTPRVQQLQSQYATELRLRGIQPNGNTMAEQIQQAKLAEYVPVYR
jgi:hypothetical protein